MSVLDKKDAERQLIADVEALYALVIDLWGADHLVLKGAKLGIMDLINSSDLGERILGLEKLVFQNPTLDKWNKSKRKSLLRWHGVLPKTKSSG